MTGLRFRKLQAVDSPTDFLFAADHASGGAGSGLGKVSLGGP